MRLHVPLALFLVYSAGCVSGVAGVNHRGRTLLQSPGAYGDTTSSTASTLDPWGTASGYYDPYGAGYIPGFINVDVSQQYGTHLDFGPVAVDLTKDYAGASIASAVGVGVSRAGDGFDVQMGNGNILDLSVTKSSGFGLWLLNGLVNVNIGPDGRWNVASTAAASAAALAAASTSTVQGVQDAGAKAATVTSTSPSAQAAAAAAAVSAASSPAVASTPASAQGTTATLANGTTIVGRTPCEGGTIVRVVGNKYTCKYLKGTAPAV